MIPGIGVNGAALKIYQDGEIRIIGCYNGYLYRSKDFGQTYQAIRSVNADYRATAVNSSGKYILAAVNYGYLYASNDAGVTWTQRTNTTASTAPNTCAMSGDGKYQYFGGYTGVGLQRSTDYGASFSIVSYFGTGNFYNVQCSHTGQYVIIVYYYNSVRYMYVSSDYGVNWTFKNYASNDYISASGSGQYIQTRPYVSIDYGVSFLSRTPFGSGSAWGSAINYSGDLMMVIGGDTSNTIHKSTNYGVNWTNTGIASASYTTYLMSSSGMYQQINTSISSDYGASWNTVTLPASPNCYAINKKPIL